MTGVALRLPQNLPPPPPWQWWRTATAPLIGRALIVRKNLWRRRTWSLGDTLVPHSRGYLILCLLLRGSSLAPPRILSSSVDLAPPLNLADLLSLTHLLSHILQPNLAPLSHPALLLILALPLSLVLQRYISQTPRQLSLVL